VIQITGIYGTPLAVNRQECAMPDATDPTQPTTKEIVAEVHEGVGGPRVELNEGDRVSIKLRSGAASPPPADEGFGGDLGVKPEPALDEPMPSYEPMPVAETMSISLDSIEVEMDNQSFGVINAVTGCASNRGGPSC
jgi:hypothetical protein